ncbi:MAG TPA: glycosyltransferase family 4 protein [Isosphaeraceae bacterium]|nr:glycosyltransferase family 4 protein [Isosphaeraceae bacterium]
MNRKHAGGFPNARSFRLAPRSGVVKRAGPPATLAIGGARLSATARPRMRVLSVVSSSNQLYSGIGRALFELTRRLTDRVEFAFAIDDAVPRNVNLLAQFCESNKIALHVGPGRAVPDALDMLNDDLPALVRGQRWDLVECICWANTATNEALLSALGDTPLCYTPHHQPTWSVPMSEAQARHVEDVHHRVLNRASLVLCDSTWERAHLQGLVPERYRCTFLPLGCDFEAFRAGPIQRARQLLFVGDLAEPRKRFDRVLKVLERLHARVPDVRLVVVGNKSDQLSQSIPAHLRAAIELRGYVSERALRLAYAESHGLFLLSDFEAFGIPILESLACGTPVFLSSLEATRSLFEGFRGAHFCAPDDSEATAHLVAQILTRGPDAIRETLADRPRLRSIFDWDILAEKKWQSLAATWFRQRSA